MEPQRLAGRDAGVLKYDLLTALSVAGLSGSPTLQTSMLRLIALVTARYNWRADELSVGQRDMARMWAVNERTVKREMKRLTEGGFLICTRSGVRGRVAAYRLNHARIAELTGDCWSLVGPDFDQRMKDRHHVARPKVVQLKNYKTSEAETPGATPWDRAMQTLSAEQPHQFEAWYARLQFVDYRQDSLRIASPSPFIKRYVETHLLRPLIAAAEAEFGPVTRVVFEG